MSLYQDKTVIVTGAAGFIGSHLVDTLLGSGASVIGIDNFVTGKKENLSHLKESSAFTFIEADVCTPVDEFLSSLDTIHQKPVALFHLASPASPVGYQAHPIETYMVNSFALHNILTYLHDFSPKTRLLFTSTSEVYGDPLKHPQDESYWGNVNPNGPRSMYDESKRLGETICGVHHALSGMDTRIVRLFNTYGPRMDLSDGRVIPDFIASIRDKKPFHIFGDGGQTRSFCYVDDTVRAIIAFVAAEGLSGETINIGNPQEITINALADTLCHIAGIKKRLEFSPGRTDDPHRRCPDISKVQRLLSWQPEVMLEEGLKRTLASFVS